MILKLLFTLSQIAAIAWLLSILASNAMRERRWKMLRNNLTNTETPLLANFKDSKGQSLLADARAYNSTPKTDCSRSEGQNNFAPQTKPECGGTAFQEMLGTISGKPACPTKSDRPDHCGANTLTSPQSRRISEPHPAKLSSSDGFGGANSI